MSLLSELGGDLGEAIAKVAAAPNAENMAARVGKLLGAYAKEIPVPPIGAGDDVVQAAAEHFDQNFTRGLNTDPNLGMRDNPHMRWFSGEFFNSQGAKATARMRLMTDAANDPRYIANLADTASMYRELFNKQMPDYAKKMGDILTRAGVDDVVSTQQFFKHVEFLKQTVNRTDPDLNDWTQTLVQTLPEAEQNAAWDPLVREWRGLTDELFEMLSGYNRVVPGVLKLFGIDSTEGGVVRRMQELQDLKRMKMPYPKNASQMDILASEATNGLIHTDIFMGHDPTAKFIDGYMTKQPLVQERTKILQLLDDFNDMTDIEKASHPEVAETMQILEARLKKIDALEVSQAQRAYPLKDQIGKKQFSAVWNIPREEGRNVVHPEEEIGYGVDAAKATQYYLRQVFFKRYMDYVRAHTRPLQKVLIEEGKKLAEDPTTRMHGQSLIDLSDLLTQWVNIQRGAVGFGYDRGILKLANGMRGMFGKLPIDMKQLHDGVTGLMALQAYSKLFLFPVRFPLINLPQTMLTLLPVVKPKNYFRAVGYTLSNWEKAYKEAVESGAFNPDVSQYFTEVYGPGVSPASRLTSILNYLPAKSEQFNRVIAYHGGRLAAMEKDFVPHKVVKLFRADVDAPGRDAIARAQEYGNAVVDATQFNYSSLNRPPIFGGGAMGKLTGQFKTYMISYSTLLKDLAKHDRAGFAYALSALWLVGGAGVMGGAVPFYSMVRNMLLQSGIRIPERPGFMWALDKTGLFNSPFMQNVIPYLPQGIDLTQAMDPFNLPKIMQGTTPQDLIASTASTMMGPTFSSLAEMIVGPMVEAAKGTPYKGFRHVLRGVSPFVLSAFEATAEALQGRFTTLGGEPISDRGLNAIIPRGLNLSPSIWFLRSQYASDIQNALKGGQVDLANALLAEAREDGIVFGKRSLSAIKGRVKTENKTEKLSVMEQLLRP
jgi:hypothetical protein